jgi:hypothetical protein
MFRLPGLFALLSFGGCTPPTSPSFLNPDPIEGGACGNGNQECVLCPNGDRCNPPKACNSLGKCDVDWNVGPDLVGAQRDGGAEAGR